MIWESGPWREELCAVADRLDARKVDCNWDDERTAFEVERDVMISAYAIRRLIEAKKLPDSLAQGGHTVEAFLIFERVPDHMNWHRIEEFYNLESGTRARLSSIDLCNQFIHSYIWMPSFTDFGLAGIFVTSQFTRTSELYLVDIDTLINFFRSVGTEEVTEATMSRDSPGQWKVSNRSRSEVDVQPTRAGPPAWLGPQEISSRDGDYDGPEPQNA